MSALGFVGLLVVPLLVIGVVVYAIVQAFRRRGAGAGDGLGVRRFFQYLLAYGLMIVAAIGLSGLLARLVERPTIVNEGGSALARALTFSVIGVPLYWAIVAWSRRQLRDDPEERASLGRGIYGTLAPLTALVVAMAALYDMLSWAFGSGSYDGGSLARLVVWGGLWLAHWLMARRHSTTMQLHTHLALGSLIGLATAGTGLVWLVGGALETLQGPGPGVLVGPSHSLGRAAATTLVGAAVWVMYWLRTFARQPHTPLWLGYVLPAGVGGGLVMAIVAGATALYDVLVWFLGQSITTSATRYFSRMPMLAGAVLVSILVWWYHRQVLEETEGTDRTEVRRIYEYLMAAGGLLAAAGGITTVIVAVIEALTGSVAIEVGTSAVNTLLAAVTLLMVGGPLWWIFWQRIQRAEGVETIEELTSPTRRIYLFLLFGLGGVVAVVALLVGVFVVIEDLLEDRFGSETLHSMRFALGLLATTGAIAFYHWAVYRQDREVAPTTERRGPRRVLLIGDDDGDLAHSVRRRTGAHVELWPRTDGVAGRWELNEVLALLEASELDEVMVISGTDGLGIVGIDAG